MRPAPLGPTAPPGVRPLLTYPVPRVGSALRGHSLDSSQVRGHPGLGGWEGCRGGGPEEGEEMGGTFYIA